MANQVNTSDWEWLRSLAESAVVMWHELRCEQGPVGPSKAQAAPAVLLRRLKHTSPHPVIITCALCFDAFARAHQL